MIDREGRQVALPPDHPMPDLAIGDRLRYLNADPKFVAWNGARDAFLGLWTVVDIWSGGRPVVQRQKANRLASFVFSDYHWLRFWKRVTLAQGVRRATRPVRVHPAREIS